MDRVTFLVLAMIAARYSLAGAGRLEPELADRLRTAGLNQRIPVIVHMARQRIDEIALRDPNLPRAERRRLVTERLQRINRKEQKELMPRVETAMKAGKSAAPERFWLVNAVALEATPDTIEGLAGDPTVQSIGLDTPIQIVFEDDADGGGELPPAVEGIRRIRAPEVWALGFAYTGAGAVVGSIDTGVRLGHDDLLLRTGGVVRSEYR